MAVKKPTAQNKASEGTKVVAVTLIDTKVYEVISTSSEGGLVKGTKYTVSGVVARALINKKLVKLK